MSVLNPKANTTIAFTDGACKGNPGLGGWGAFLVFEDGATQAWCGGDKQTTNNRMELMGAIAALQNSPAHTTLEIWTDSSYVKNGITQWIEGWKKKDWKNSAKKPVANKDLWQQLDVLRQNRSVSWHWVKGHAGHLGNEKADELANLGVERVSQGLVEAFCSESFTGNKSSNGNNSIDAHNEGKKSDDWMFNDPLGFGELDADETLDGASGENDSNDACFNDPNHSQNGATDDLPKFDGDTSRANPHFKPLLPKPINAGKTGRQLVMDTETTGLDAQKGDRIIEVGIVEMVGRKPTGEKLHVYINPERSMDEEAFRIHGISEAFLQDKPKFAEVAQTLFDFMHGAEIIAHNAPFDMGFLVMEFDKVGLKGFANSVQVTDSLVLAKQQYPGQRNTLDALVRRLNVGKQDRSFHGALLDAEILAEVYLAMTGGQVALAIDEDVQSHADSGGGHSQFTHLASKLVVSAQNPEAHNAWMADLVADYPELKTVWQQ